MELLLLLIIIVIGYLWWNDLLPGKDDITENFSNNDIVDVNTFDKYYAGRRNQIHMGRLDKEKNNEFVTVFLLVVDASNKNRQSVSIKDVPHDSKFRNAFMMLANNPNRFFDNLIDITKDYKPIYADPDKETYNLGLNIELSPTKTIQYNPKPPVNMSKYIERSRGNY